MISVWWLILIVPVSIALGVFIMDRVILSILGGWR